MIRNDRGSAAVMTIVMLPFLVAIVAGVAQIGALRVIASRVAEAADLATLAAVDDQDDAELARSGVLRLSPDAPSVARQYFGLNLGQLAPLLAVTPADAAAAADVSTSGNSVRLSAAVPVHAPVLAALLLPATIVVNVRATSTPR